MTTVQIGGHLVLVATPIALFLNEPSLNYCILRQIVVGVAFTLTISVNISKTQKLFMICGRTTLMSRSEVIITNASEWFIISIILLINVLLLIVSLVQQQVTVSIKYHDSSLIKELHCNNNNYTYVQILYATFLVLCNGIQGFRARKLPSHFRETTHVIYSSFIFTVISAASIGLYFSQRKEISKTLVILFTTIVLNTVNFLLFYYYKVYVMIFKPEWNTKKAFNQRRLKKMAFDNHGLE